MTERDIAREIKMAIFHLNLLVATMRDRASVNNLAMDTITLTWLTWVLFSHDRPD